MYLIRLDDASEYMDNDKWNRIETMLDKYGVKPIIGIIPDNQDEELRSRYDIELEFWNRAKTWKSKGWSIAMHGYTHVYSSQSGGINPVNLRSEFAGLELEEQRKKIAMGVEIFRKKDLDVKIFFAPSHTFDMNTLEAIRLESDIRVISDTIANDVYRIGEFYFIPQQSGRVRNLPFKVSTFCYHPNTMCEQDFIMLEEFIKKNKDKFGSYDELIFNDRKPNIYDKVLRLIYFSVRVMRNRFRGL
jgi:predicted deacetylase